MTAALMLEIFRVFGPIVREIIAKYQRDNHTTAMPTDAEMLRTFNANADRILAEGAAWKASQGL